MARTKTADVAPAGRKPLLISYLRFSKPEQMRGDTVRRQLEASAAWALAHGMVIDDSLTDKGLSAYDNTHAEFGAFGELLRLIRAGLIPRGSILLVECLDRLSRDKVRKQLKQFLELIEAGITIVTLVDGYEYSEDNCDEIKLIISISIMARAHEESATKSKRVSAAWQNKKRNAATKPLTARLPAWLRLTNGRIVLHEPSAQIIRRIFDLAVEGYGIRAITRLLVAEGVKGFNSRYMQVSYVNKVLRSRATIGEYQPRKCVDNGKRFRDKVTDGAPVPNYFPPVITEAIFYAAQNMLKGRDNCTGPNTQTVNLFKGLIFDGADGAHMHLRCRGGSKPMVRRDDGRYYVSSSELYKHPNFTGYRTFPRQPLESGIICNLAYKGFVSFEDYKTNAGQTTANRLESIQGEIADIEAKVDKINDDVVRGGSATAVVSLLTKLDARKQMLEAEAEELKGNEATACAMPQAMRELREAAEDIKTDKWEGTEKDRRIRLQGAVRRLVKRIDCRFERAKWFYKCHAKVTLNNGETSKFSFGTQGQKVKPRWKMIWDIG